jgi:hypothetical protein
METAENQPVPDSPADRPPSTEGVSDCAALSEEINRLREIMTDTFSREASFTSESVMAVSRELDHKINEYMQKVRTKLGCNPGRG